MISMHDATKAKTNDCCPACLWKVSSKKASKHCLEGGARHRHLCGNYKGINLSVADERYLAGEPLLIDVLEDPELRQTRYTKRTPIQTAVSALKQCGFFQSLGMCTTMRDFKTPNSRTRLLHAGEYTR